MNILFDPPRHDYARFAIERGLPYFRTVHFAVNPWTGPPNCPREEWYQDNSTNFCTVTYLRGASRFYMFHQAVDLQSKLVQEGRELTFLALASHYQNLRPKGQTDRELALRAIEKFIPFGYANPQYGYEVGIPLHRLIERNRSFVLELPDLAENGAFLQLYMIQYLFSYRKHNPERPRPPVRFWMDEARHLMRASNTEGTFDLIGDLVTTGRGLNAAFGVATQSPSELTASIRSNPDVVIGLADQAQEVKATQEIQGLDREQAAEIHNLSPGQGVVTLKGPRLKGPVLVDIPLYPVSSEPVTEDELNRYSLKSLQGLLDGVKKAEPPEPQAEEPKADPDRLPKDEYACMKRIVHEVEILEDRITGLGWDPSREYVARSKLQRRGHVHLAGRIGNKKAVHRPTPKGLAFGRKQGWKEPKFKSGPLHEAAKRTSVKRILRSIGKQVRYFDHGLADILGGRQPDFGLQCRGGRLILGQVHDRNKLEWEALLDLASREDVDAVLSISVDRATRVKLEKQLANKNRGRLPPKVIMLDIEKVLSEHGWTWLVERKV